MKKYCASYLKNILYKQHYNNLSRLSKKRKIIRRYSLKYRIVSISTQEVFGSFFSLLHFIGIIKILQEKYLVKNKNFVQESNDKDL